MVRFLSVSYFFFFFPCIQGTYSRPGHQVEIREGCRNQLQSNDWFLENVLKILHIPFEVHSRNLNLYWLKPGARLLLFLLYIILGSEEVAAYSKSGRKWTTGKVSAITVGCWRLVLLYQRTAGSCVRKTIISFSPRWMLLAVGPRSSHWQAVNVSKGCSPSTKIAARMERW